MKQRRELPSQERLRELFDYNPDTGIFTRRVDRRKWKAGQVVGTRSGDGYININVDYQIYRAHRLAWKYMTGLEPSGYGIDHKNGERSDNRWENLREATQTENMSNRTVQKNNAAGLKGVHPYGKNGRYRACATKHGKTYNLGCYGTIEEAKAAYDAGAKLIHGDFFSS